MQLDRIAVLEPNWGIVRQGAFPLGVADTLASYQEQNFVALLLLKRIFLQSEFTIKKRAGEELCT